MDVEQRKLEHLRTAVSSGQGVLVTPNHSGHADAYIMYDVADELRMPFYFMTAWQVFQQQSLLGQRMLQHHGCFYSWAAQGHRFLRHSHRGRQRAKE